MSCNCKYVLLWKSFLSVFAKAQIVVIFVQATRFCKHRQGGLPQQHKFTMAKLLPATLSLYIKRCYSNILLRKKNVGIEGSWTYILQLNRKRRILRTFTEARWCLRITTVSPGKHTFFLLFSYIKCWFLKHCNFFMGFIPNM